MLLETWNTCVFLHVYLTVLIVSNIYLYINIKYKYVYLSNFGLSVESPIHTYI